jgi:hypothetical protein
MLLPVADQRILRGVTSTLTWQNLNGDGEPAAPAGPVTVGVVNAAGATVVATGTATTGDGEAPRTFSLPAASNTQLDWLTVTWTDTGDGSAHSTLVEVVGAYFFTIDEARKADPALSNDAKFPTQALTVARRQVEDEFEAICDVAFVPRYRRERAWPAFSTDILLSRPNIRTVRAISDVAGDGTLTAWTADQLVGVVIDGSTIRTRTGLRFPSEAIIDYEHGHLTPPPEVKRAALQRLRYLVAQPLSGVPDRASRFTVTEGGTYTLDTAGPDRTGIPDIDAVLARYSRRVPGVA